MAFDFDPSLNGLWILLAGQSAPRVLVDAARAQGGVWWSARQQLSALFGQIDGLVGQVQASVGGDVGEAFGSRVRGLRSSLAPLLEIAAGQYIGIMNLALSVDSVNKSMLIEINLFLDELAWALASPFTAPLVPSLLAGARVAARELLEDAHWAIRAAARVAGAVGHEALEEALESAAAQLWQVAEGFRHQADKKDLWTSGLGGGIAGGGMHGYHGAANRLKKGAGEGIAGHAGGEMFAEAITPVFMSPLGGGGPLGADVWQGTVNGAFTGGAPAAVHKFHGGHGETGVAAGQIVDPAAGLAGIGAGFGGGDGTGGFGAGNVGTTSSSPGGSGGGPDGSGSGPGGSSGGFGGLTGPGEAPTNAPVPGNGPPTPSNGPP
ncbi:MAG TPA: hypothetical protein VJT31_11870, partial [Rugosimonospora sp.]|nr:hypothetical protein [Rugosimonospora sp.]